MCAVDRWKSCVNLALPNALFNSVTLASIRFSYNGSRHARRPLSQEPCAANIVTAKSKNRTLVSPREQSRDSSVHRSGAPSVPGHRDKRKREAFTA